MADKLGPGSYNSTQLAIDLMILQMNDIECQRIKNSESERLTHKHSSYQTSDVQLKYGEEIQLIRNEMRESEDKTSKEYYDLMSELEELETERDSKTKLIEDELADAEKKYEIQDTTLETQYNAVKADKEGMEDVQKSKIER